MGLEFVHSINTFSFSESSFFSSLGGRSLPPLITPAKPPLLCPTRRHHHHAGTGAHKH
jgi:hypothetical protein